MAVVTGVTVKRPTHHVKLSLSGTDVGLVLCDQRGNQDARAWRKDPAPRTALKIYEGDVQYSDGEPPWMDIAQEDWSGGRNAGRQSFDKAQDQYADSLGMDGRQVGRLVAGPMVSYATGVRGWCGHWQTVEQDTGTNYYYSRSCSYIVLLDTSRYAAGKCQTGAAFQVGKIWLYARKRGNPGSLSVYIYSDNNNPNLPITAALTVTAASVEADVWTMVAVDSGMAAPLSASTYYWLVVVGDSADTVDNCWEILTLSGGVGGKSGDGASWSSITGSGGTSLMFRFLDLEKPFKAHFANLKNMLFVGLEYLDGADSKVFQNGTGGVATAGAAGYVRDANNAAIIADAFNGGRLYLWNGAGSSNHRKILDTVATPNKDITVAVNFDAAPGAGTEYAVMDVDSFVDISVAFGAGRRITDALSVNGAIYWACGDGTNIRRLRYFLSGGSYAQFTDESAAGTFLEVVVDGAITKVWKATRSLPPQVACADGLDCNGTGAVAALTWGTATNVGDRGVKVTGLGVYGEEFPRLMIFKEDSVNEIIGSVPYEKRIAGLREMQDGWSGLTNAVVGVYLFWNLGELVLRYYSGQVDNKSPYLPVDRRGRPSDMVVYGDHLYMAVDGGENNTSSILCYTGTGWHEMYRAPFPGLRIMSLHVQPIPGVGNVDRLWFSCGSDVAWIPLALDPTTFNNITNYLVGHTTYHASVDHFYSFNPVGYLDMSKMWVNRQMIDKLFSGGKIIYDGDLSSLALWLWYRVDGGAWTRANNYIYDDPEADIIFNSGYSLVGKKIELRVELVSNLYESLIIEGVVLETVLVEPTKYVYTLVFRAEDNEPVLTGSTPDPMTAAAKMAQLRTWASNASAVLMNSTDPELDGKYVRVDPVTPRVVEVLEHDKRRTYICQMVLYEVG